MALRKKFIDVEIPIINEILPVLGEREALHKKTIKLDLSRKLKGKGLEVTFLILNKDNKLIGYPKDLILMRSYIQRMMRKRANYVEDSFDISCTDIPAKIKPFLITRKKVSRAIRNNLRKTTKEFLIEYTKTKTYMELAEETIVGTIQKEMYPKLKKIYPLSLCEIRVLETKQIEKANLTEKIKEIKVEEQEEILDQAAEAEAAIKAKEEAKVEETEDKPKKSKKKVEEEKKEE